MMQSFFRVFWVLSLLPLNGWAQKKPLTVDDFDRWERIVRVALPKNGAAIAVELKPASGDPHTELRSADSTWMRVWPRTTEAQWAADGRLLALRRVLGTDTVRQLKLAKTRKDKWPKDTLLVWHPTQQRVDTFAGLRRFALPPDGGAWVALLQDAPKKTVAKTDTTGKPSKAPRTPAGADAKALGLLKVSGVDVPTWQMDSVSDFALARNGARLAWVRQRFDSVAVAQVWVSAPKGADSVCLFRQPGFVGKLSLSDDGAWLAFLFSADTTQHKAWQLYLGRAAGGPLLSVAKQQGATWPKGWCASADAALRFARNGSKLYFGLKPCPKPETKDTVPDDEKVRLDIWHWKDTRLQPEQLKQADDDRKRSATAIVRLADGRLLVPDTNRYLQWLHTPSADAERVLLRDAQPYWTDRSWQGHSLADYYVLDARTGQKRLVKRAVEHATRLSPNARFFAYFEPSDSSWRSIDLDTGAERKHPIAALMVHRRHDLPEQAPPYGSAGWTTDNQLWVYDEYDVWSIDPTAHRPATNLTRGWGRKKALRLRYRAVLPEQEAIEARTAIFHGFWEQTKNEGFYRIEKNGLQSLVEGPYNLAALQRAEQAERYFWTQANLQTPPDYHTAGADFDRPKRLTGLNPQQANYNWATVELFRWQVGGETEEGLLYKPANFDSTRKYPVVVYFYELYSDELHRHLTPQISRSTINPLVFASNGYLVFIPNIRYTLGHPGQSALRYVLSGTDSLARLPFVDGQRMGIQGQSWGGYQVAYLVTHTNRYKAAWAGAPVSNMTSAYGGIRWESGMSRMFQYEKTQSRIGATLWDAPELYIENSPLFRVPHIQTPLAIMHNDADGAVPWYQGIELFVALRRLQKPAWLLNYNGEPHNLRPYSPNGKDLSQRLMQFFDHYLKDAPAPRWMQQGVPAVDKGEDYGW